MKRLYKKTVLITGGASGIGLAATKQFVSEGAYVYTVGRRLDALEKAASEIGKQVRPIRADISKLEDLDRVFEIIRQERGRIDVLFANAGVGELSPLGAMPLN